LTNSLQKRLHPASCPFAYSFWNLTVPQAQGGLRAESQSLFAPCNPMRKTLRTLNGTNPARQSSVARLVAISLESTGGKKPYDF